MDAAGSAQPEGRPSLRLIEHGREVARSDRSTRLPLGRQGRSAAEVPVARSAQGKTAASATASTPYAAHSRQTAWLEEHEQTSRPRGENSRRRCPSPEHYTRPDHSGSPLPRVTHGREMHRSNRFPHMVSQHGRERRSPSVVEVERHPDTPIKVLGTAARPTVLPFSTPFSTWEFTKPRCMCKIWMMCHTAGIFLPP